jgi:hypothetical protein
VTYEYGSIERIRNWSTTELHALVLTVDENATPAASAAARGLPQRTGATQRNATQLIHSRNSTVQYSTFPVHLTQVERKQSEVYCTILYYTIKQ